MTDDMIDVEAFRLEARAWLAENLDRRDPASGRGRIRGLDTKTVASVAKERVLQRRLYEGGYAGITWPTAYGGRGLTKAHEKAFDEEAQDYITPDFGVLSGTTFRICVPTMITHASEEFLRRHVPAVLAGDELWVQFFSEPEAGSDLAAVRTRATRDGDRWILSGAKIWSSGAMYADYGMCLARTDWEAPKHRGLTWFAVPTSAPGVTIQQITEINGHGEFCQEFFDDVVLSDDDVIGEVNQGWPVARTMLAYERGGGGTTVSQRGGREPLAADLVALARRVGRERDPAVRQLVARGSVNDFAQHELAARIAWLESQNGVDAGVAAYGKLTVGTFDPIRARIGLQIGGSDACFWHAGVTAEVLPSLNYLNCRVMSIAGGTNEMQRNGIGERVLGLPREPSFDSAKPFSEVIRDARQWTGASG